MRPQFVGGVPAGTIACRETNLKAGHEISVGLDLVSQSGSKLLDSRIRESVEF